MNLQQAVKRVIRDYPSLRAAGADLGIDHAYLWKMLHGVKKNPSEDALKRLGIEVDKEREVTYRWVK